MISWYVKKKRGVASYKKKTTNKYNAKSTRVDGYYFPSQLEADTYLYLKTLVLANLIGDLKCQDTVSLTKAEIKWKVDFRYFDLEKKETCWAESKGISTTDYLIKKKLWHYYGPGTLHVYKRDSRGTIRLAETIIPDLG